MPLENATEARPPATPRMATPAAPMGASARQPESGTAIPIPGTIASPLRSIPPIARQIPKSGRPPPDDFFNDEEHRRNRRVESGCQACRRAYRGDKAHAVARQAHFASQYRGEASTDLQRRIFWAQRMSRPDRKGCRNEFPDRRPKGNMSVVDVQRGLGLIDATTARRGKKVNDEKRDHQSRQAGCEQKPRRGENCARSQQIQTGPVNGKAKHTTDRPEKIPMKTDKTRKNRSSRKTVLHSALRFETGIGGCVGHGCFSTKTSVSALDCKSTLTPLRFCDQ